MLKEIESHYSDWALAVVLLGIFLVLAFRIYNPRKFKSFLYLPIRGTGNAEKGFNLLSWRNSSYIFLALNAFFTLPLSILLFIYSYSSNELSASSWREYLQIFFIFSSFFLIKSLVQLAIGWAFNKTESVSLNQNIQLSHWAWIALFIIPINAIMVFVNSFPKLNFWLLLIFLSVGWLQALFKSGSHLWKMPISAFYKIFYFCSTEIIPFIFLIKWLQAF